MNGITDSMDMRLSRDSEEQGKLVCGSPWGHKESDTAEHLNNKHDRRECWSSKHVQRHKVTFVMAAGLVERLGKALMLGKIEGFLENGAAENEMVR